MFAQDSFHERTSPWQVCKGFVKSREALPTGTLSECTIASATHDSTTPSRNLSLLKSLGCRARRNTSMELQHVHRVASQTRLSCSPTRGEDSGAPIDFQSHDVLAIVRSFRMETSNPPVHYVDVDAHTTSCVAWSGVHATGTCTQSYHDVLFRACTTYLP